MRTVALSFLIFFPLIAFSQEPAPPTQEWCEWAFGQIPDKKEFADADSTVFSSDFYCLLKEVHRLSKWEFEIYECEPVGDGCLLYWYGDMEGSPLDGGRAKVYFDFTPQSPLEGEVIVTIDHPDYLNYDGTRVSKYRMSVKYENGAWRINDWDGKWVEIAIVFREYQNFESGNVTIDSRAQTIINKDLEHVELRDWY